MKMRPTTSDISVATSSGGSGSHYYYSHSHPTTITTSSQWAHNETIELISIRGQLEKNFNNKSKRTKQLWETVASSLRDKGFFRSPHQCKSKWKNLLTRYKATETSDPENGKQCPFFEELHAVFTERNQNLQMESQQLAVQSRKKQKLKSNSGDHFSDEFSQDDNDEGDDSNRAGSIRNRNAKKRRKRLFVNPKCANSSNISSSVQETLRGFLQHQERIEMQWRESMDRHQREKEIFEHEWRQSMEKLEREGLVMEQAWREREEQWKIKEETRAEKSDALLTTLLTIYNHHWDILYVSPIVHATIF